MIKDNLVDDIHFTRLKPLLVGQYAPIIQDSLVSALRGQIKSPEAVTRLMAGVHNESIQVWVALTGEGQEKQLVGMLFTQIMTDPFIAHKHLLIYGLNLKVQMTTKAFGECSDILERFAKDKGCSFLQAQTEISGVRKLMERNGWETKTTLHEKEI